ncbi:MAG: tryptophan dimethylallyltransferase family protein [Myxococcota bacterium]
MSDTVFGRAQSELTLLAQALGLGAQVPAWQQSLGAYLHRMRDRPLDLPPLWSGLSDDCTPWELSIVLRPAAVDLRILLEAQAEPATPSSYWEAALALTESLDDADRSRFHSLAPLFRPTDPGAFWALWNAIDFGRGARPMHKIYFNAAASGPAEAPRLVRTAMEQLGFGAAADALFSRLDPSDQLTHISLDLGAQAAGRLKIYARHRAASFARLEELFAYSPSHRAGDVELLGRVGLGAPDFSRRPVFGVFHFVDPRNALPHRTTLNVPTIPYAANDAEVTERLRALIAHLGLDEAPYRAACSHLFRGRDPAQERGRHSYLSLQRDGEAPRLTIYFGAMLFRDRYGLHGIDPTRTWPSPI